MSISLAISLALVTHRDPGGTRRALAGLRRSFRNGPRFSILILENGADENFDQERSLRREFPELDLRWVRLRRNSMCEARQKALETLTTPWVAFLDSDCRVFASWSSKVERRLKELEQNPGIWAWSPPVLNRGFSASARLNRWLGRFFPAHARVKEARQVSHVPSSQVFYRRDRVLEIGGFPAGFDQVGEDLSLSHRIVQAGGQIWIYPEPRVLHAQKSGIATHLLRLERYGRAQGALFRRAPTHLADRRFLPLWGFLVGAVLLLASPGAALAVLIAAAAGWFWKGPRMGGAGPQTAGLIFVFASLLCYAGGTLRGAILPRSVRR